MLVGDTTARPSGERMRMDWRLREQPRPDETTPGDRPHIRLRILTSVARGRGTLLPLIAGLVSLT